VLAVGDSTDVEIIFNTGHYTSRVNKSASIICNAPGMAPSLNIIAIPTSSPESLSVFRVSPPAVSLDSLRPEQQSNPWEYDFVVHNVSSEDLDLKLVSIPYEFLKVDVPSGSIKPGHDKTIKVKVDQNVADQIFSKSFTLEASDSTKTRLTVPISKAMRWGPTSTSP
jgi:hypothetical protein